MGVLSGSHTAPSITRHLGSNLNCSYPVTGAMTLTMPEWGIGVAEQDQTGIGRQAVPIEIEVDGFGPDWDQTQRRQLKWGGERRCGVDSGGVALYSAPANAPLADCT